MYINILICILFIRLSNIIFKIFVTFIKINVTINKISVTTFKISVSFNQNLQYLCIIYKYYCRHFAK